MDNPVIDSDTFNADTLQQATTGLSRETINDRLITSIRIIDPAYDCLPVVYDLLQSNADPNSLSDDGNSAMMWAAWSDMPDIIALLLQYNGNPFYSHPTTGQTALTWASMRGSIPCCRVLLDYTVSMMESAKGIITTNKTDGDRNKSDLEVWSTSTAHHLHPITLSDWSKIHRRITQSNSSHHKVHSPSITHQDVKSTILLSPTSAVANPHDISSHYAPALSYVLHPCSEGLPALHHAVHGNHRGLADMLLILFPTLLHSFDQKLRTPLHIACRLNLRHIATMLIDRGADMTMQDKDGQTPLYHALLRRNYDLVRLLLRFYGAGRAVNIPNIQGENLLDLATRLNAPFYIIQLLQEHGSERFHLPTWLFCGLYSRRRYKSLAGRTGSHIPGSGRHRRDEDWHKQWPSSDHEDRDSSSLDEHDDGYNDLNNGTTELTPLTKWTDDRLLHGYNNAHNERDDLRRQFDSRDGIDRDPNVPSPPPEAMYPEITLPRSESTTMHVSIADIVEKVTTPRPTTDISLPIAFPEGSTQSHSSSSFADSSSPPSTAHPHSHVSPQTPPQPDLELRDQTVNKQIDHIQAKQGGSSLVDSHTDNTDNTDPPRVLLHDRLSQTWGYTYTGFLNKCAKTLFRDVYDRDITTTYLSTYLILSIIIWAFHALFVLIPTIIICNPIAYDIFQGTIIPIAAALPALFPGITETYPPVVLLASQTEYQTLVSQLPYAMIDPSLLPVVLRYAEGASAAGSVAIPSSGALRWLSLLSIPPEVDLSLRLLAWLLFAGGSVVTLVSWFVCHFADPGYIPSPPLRQPDQQQYAHMFHLQYQIFDRRRQDAVTANPTQSVDASEPPIPPQDGNQVEPASPSASQTTFIDFPQKIDINTASPQPVLIYTTHPLHSSSSNNRAYHHVVTHVHPRDPHMVYAVSLEQESRKSTHPGLWSSHFISTPASSLVYPYQFHRQCIDHECDGGHHHSLVQTSPHREASSSQHDITFQSTVISSASPTLALDDGLDSLSGLHTASIPMSSHAYRSLLSPALSISNPWLYSFLFNRFQISNIQGFYLNMPTYTYHDTTEFIDTQARDGMNSGEPLSSQPTLPSWLHIPLSYEPLPQFYVPLTSQLPTSPSEHHSHGRQAPCQRIPYLCPSTSIPTEDVVASNQSVELTNQNVTSITIHESPSMSDLQTWYLQRTTLPSFNQAPYIPAARYLHLLLNGIALPHVDKLINQLPTTTYADDPSLTSTSTTSMENQSPPHIPANSPLKQYLPQLLHSQHNPYYPPVISPPMHTPPHHHDENGAEIIPLPNVNDQEDMSRNCGPLQPNKSQMLCYSCRIAMPVLARHCHDCNRCTLLDHHCPWIDNCVGAGNYRSFMLFTSCGTIMSWVYIILLVTSFLHINITIPQESSPIASSNTTTSVIFLPVSTLSIVFLINAFILALFVLALFLSHIFLVLSNDTTMSTMSLSVKFVNYTHGLFPFHDLSIDAVASTSISLINGLYWALNHGLRTFMMAFFHGRLNLPLEFPIFNHKTYESVVVPENVQRLHRFARFIHAKRAHILQQTRSQEEPTVTPLFHRLVYAEYMHFTVKRIIFMHLLRTKQGVSRM